MLIVLASSGGQIGVKNILFSKRFFVISVYHISKNEKFQILLSKISLPINIKQISYLETKKLLRCKQYLKELLVNETQQLFGPKWLLFA